MEINGSVGPSSSEKFFDLFSEARDLNKKGLYHLNEDEKYYLNETDIGEWGLFEGEYVPLDYPILEGEENEICNITEKARTKKRRKKKAKKKKGKTTTPSRNLYKGKGRRLYI